MMKVIKAEAAREILRKRLIERDIEIEAKVAEIVEEVRSGGDRALCSLISKFDGLDMTSEKIKVSEEEISEAVKEVDRDFLGALKSACENIRDYHEKQLLNSWFDSSREGVMLGQLITPLDRVGIYVPGGKASYPSSVLMNAIPAKVAGVREIAMATPPGKDGSINKNILAAAAETGITEIYRMGGAHAVAALAYGTETVRPVDKIAGPGNRYVTMAKRLVFGSVGIDMLAGPSELLVIADSSAKPEYVAADLLSQAEHDEMAAVVLITPDRDLAQAVSAEVERQLLMLARSAIAAKSVSEYGSIIVTGSLEEAFEIANSFAPEHLELAVSDPFSWLGAVRAAGAVFLGHNTPEPVGDYMAGPSHVLPTGGTARFSSPLGVDHFVKRTSVISYSRLALEREAPGIIKLASVEGLDAHAASVEIRMKREDSGYKKRVKDENHGEIIKKKFNVIQGISTQTEQWQGDNTLAEIPGMPVLPDRGQVIGREADKKNKKPEVGGSADEKI